MPSFDIVSKVPWNDVDNALNQAQKELAQRYDFKDTETDVTKDAESITVRSASEERAKAAWGVVQEKLIKRKVSLKFFDAGEPEATGKGGAKITIEVKEGITQEPAKKITQAIKDSKIKVQASIQEAQVRVSGKNKDDLQSVIALCRAAGLPIDLQFINFRD